MASEISTLSQTPFNMGGTHMPKFLKDTVHTYLKDIISEGVEVSDLMKKVNEYFKRDYPHLLLEFKTEKVPSDATSKAKLKLYTIKRSDDSEWVCGKCKKVFEAHKKMCQQCDMVAYCSRDCRKADGDHRQICRDLARANRIDSDENIKRNKRKLINDAKKSYSQLIDHCRQLRDQKTVLNELESKINPNVDKELSDTIEEYRKVLDEMYGLLLKFGSIFQKVIRDPITTSRDEGLLSYYHCMLEDGSNFESAERRIFKILGEQIAKAGNNDLMEVFQKLKKLCSENTRFLNAKID